MAGPVRTSARVIVVDDDGCVLLIRALDALDNKPPLWITPGGSLEGNESVSEAAVRELREETGHATTPDQLGEPVAVSRGKWNYRGTPLQSEDWYFGLRAQRSTPVTDGYTALEGDVLGTRHWWAPEELASSSEIVIPKSLLEVVTLILQETPVGGSPVILPWTSL
jgi:8-oxo-dGTP pyrophosphatase MutT (NUDIX family)